MNINILKIAIEIAAQFEFEITDWSSDLTSYSLVLHLFSFDAMQSRFACVAQRGHLQHSCDNGNMVWKRARKRERERRGGEQVGMTRGKRECVDC